PHGVERAGRHHPTYAASTVIPPRTSRLIEKSIMWACGLRMVSSSPFDTVRRSEGGTAGKLAPGEGANCRSPLLRTLFAAPDVSVGPLNRTQGAAKSVAPMSH